MSFFVNDDYGNIVRNVKKKNLAWQEWALKKKQGKCLERPAYLYVWKQTMSPIEIQQPIFLRMHMWLRVLHSCVYLELTQHL